MRERKKRRHRENPDWYRVKYSLAAECFNWAYVRFRQRGASWRREEIDEPSDGETTPRQSLEEAGREARELLIAINECIEAPREAEAHSSHEPPGDDPLLGFLGGHLRPGLLVLLAGIEQLNEDTRGTSRLEFPRDLSPADFEGEIRAGESFDPDELVEWVEARWRPTPASVNYNLACFHAQRGRNGSARGLIRLCVEGTPPSEWVRLRREIALDPVIGDLVPWLDEEIFRAFGPSLD